jgi:hypothetical protein
MPNLLLKQAAAALAIGLALAAPDAAAEPYLLKQTIANPSPDAGDGFGQSIALSGGRALVGAAGDDSEASNAGRAYLFNAGSGALLQTLTSPTRRLTDNFGISVALSPAYALVGSTGADAGGTNAGAAHLYDVTTGALLRTFMNPTPTAADNFGISVALSGNRALISASGDDAGGTNNGAAYLFDVTTGALLQTFTNPTPGANDNFGSAVALVGDKALIAAQNDDTGALLNTGAVHLFDVTTGAHLRTFANPTPNTSDTFGADIALSATRVLIGARQDDARGANAGAAYLFDLGTGNLVATLFSPHPAASDFFGDGVALNERYAVIGSALDNTQGTDRGAAYLFNAETGELVQELFDPVPGMTDRYGVGLALDGDGLLVGAPNDLVDTIRPGQAFYYELPSAPPPPIGVPEPATLALVFAGLALAGGLRRALAP